MSNESDRDESVVARRVAEPSPDNVNDATNSKDGQMAKSPLPGGAVTVAGSRVRPRAPRTKARIEKRVTFNLRPTDAKRLAYMADRIEGSENDALRHALATATHLQQLVDLGGTVVIEDKNGRQRVIEFVV